MTVPLDIGVQGSLPTCEVFGPVTQGEGPHTGLRVGFLRLGGCNLACTWCDTPYTWDNTRYDLAEENPAADWKTTAVKVNALDCDTIILTGGEPLIHQRTQALRLLVATITAQVHMETNGTIRPDNWIADRIAHWSVSPKLGNSGDPAKRRLKPKALEWFAQACHTRSCAFKFVAETPADLDEADDLVNRYFIPRQSVWIMPEGRDTATILDRARILESHILSRRFNLSLRQHVLLHGDERGW